MRLARFERAAYGLGILLYGSLKALLQADLRDFSILKYGGLYILCTPLIVLNIQRFTVNLFWIRNSDIYDSF